MKKIYCTRKLFPCAKRSVYYTLKNFYQKIGIDDLCTIQSKANLTMCFLDNEKVGVFKVGRRLIKGKKTPVAMIRDPNENKPIVINGKPYLRDCGDWVVLILSGDKAHLVIEHTNIFAPHEWGGEDDYFRVPNTYVPFTDDRAKDVFDTLN